MPQSVVVENGRSSGAGARLSARNVTIYYWIERQNQPFLAVDSASLEVEPGEFVSIVVPSGCGKTTLLSAIDGLLPISGGQLTLNGRAITKPGTPPPLPKSSA